MSRAISSVERLAACGALALLAACGQKGPLYLPDRNTKVITHSASSQSVSSGKSSASSSSSSAHP